MVDRSRISCGVLVALAVAASAEAQVIGTFSWQTLPYCNRVTLTVVQHAARFQLIGSDDLCGAGPAPVTGTAVPAGGGVSFGFMAVLPGGAPAHISATISLATLSGAWSDADGRSGAFGFGANVGGPPRPEPARATAIVPGQFAPSVYGGSGSAATIARSDHLHDDRYDTSATVDSKVAAAILTPNHVTTTQVVDGSLSLADIFGTSNRSYNLGTLSVPGSGCIVVSVTSTGDAFRLLLPIRLGLGIPGSALLSAYPVVLNTSDQAALQVCNRSATPFNAAGVILEYRVS